MIKQTITSDATNIYILHQKIHQLQYFTEVLKGEQYKQKEQVIQIIKNILKEKRTFCLLDTQFPTLSESDVLEFISSQLYTSREKQQIFSTASAVPFQFSANNMPFNIFAQRIEHNMDSLLDCIVYFYNSYSKDLPIHPCKNLLSFFASSTFPGMFGYLWNHEQSEKCVIFLVKLILLQIDFLSKSVSEKPIVMSSKFRNSFLKEIIRIFIHISGIQPFLSQSLMYPLLDVFDETTIDDDSDKTADVVKSFESVAHHSKEILVSLLQHIHMMPQIVLKFFNCVSDEVSKKYPNEVDQLLRVIFFSMLLQPSLINPKNYAIFPINYIIPRSSCLTSIVKVLSQAFDLTKTTSAQQNIDIGSDIAKEIIYNLPKTKSAYGLISIHEILTQFDLNSFPMLYSPSDYLVLAHIVNNTPEKAGQSELRSICSFEKTIDLSNVEFCDFWFDCFQKNPKHANNLLELPILQSSQIEIPEDEVTSAAQNLNKYLMNIIPDISAPNNIRQFFDYQQKKSAVLFNSRSQSITFAIKNKILSINNDDLLIKRSNELISSTLRTCNYDMANSFNNQEMVRKLTELEDFSTNLNVMQTPLIFQNLISLFFIKNPNLWDDFNFEKQKIIGNSDDWRQKFYRISEEILKSYTTVAFNKDQKKMLQMQIHSFLLKEIPLNDFAKRYVVKQKQGRIFAMNKDSHINAFVKEGHSDSLKKLLSRGVYFDSAIELLKRITKVGPPLEIVDIITRVFDTLQNIYGFDSGEEIPGDDFLPLVIFTIMKAGIPEIFVILAYLQHFLQTPEGDILFFEKTALYIYTSFATAVDIVCNSSIEPK